MIKIENTEVMGWEAAIRGMRNPMNSWEKSDSFLCRDVEDGTCPEGNKSQSNAISVTLRKIQRDDLGGIANTIHDSVIDLCPECMDEFEEFMTKGGSSDEK